MGRNIKDKKMIKIIVSIIILLALLVAILLVRQSITKQSDQKEIEKIKSYTTMDEFKSVEEVAKYMECNYIKEETSEEENYKLDIYMQIKVLPYSDDTSNEAFYNNLISYCAKVLKFENFRIIDKKNNITIEVICDKEKEAIKSIIINGESDLQTSIFYTFYNEEDWNYVLTKDYIIENSSNEIYTLKDKKICIDYVESEENKTLYIKKNVSGELEENMQTGTIETSEWNILRTKDKSNWSERPETGEKIIYVGIGITGEKIDATEEEKIEYINMINPDLYIRKVIFDDNAKTTYTYITTDDKGKQVQQTVEGYIPIMIGYYNEKQKNVAKQYVTLKDEYTDENYYSDQFYNVTTKLFSNDIINEKCLVPTIAQCVGFRIQEDGKYVIEFFKFGKSNGLGSIKEAIADNTAQNLIKINELKNEKIKSNAENEINYAIIKNDSGEDINSNLQDEKKSFSITTKDVIVLAIIGIMIVICLIILEINIMKRKNN